MADNTLRGKRLKVADPELLKPSYVTDKDIVPDTVFNPSGQQITLSGYDKPLNSSKETMLVTNNTDRTISSLRMEITYMDLSGRELHSATVDIDTSIPAGRTKKIVFPSWDTQLSFYYHLGKKPRTDNVTPYTIGCDIIYFTTITEQ